MNPFLTVHGPDKLRQPLPIALLLSVVFITSYLTATKGLVAALAVLVLPLVAIYVGALFINPRIGIVTILIFNFFVLGIGRYIPMTWGLLMDGIMVLMYLALFFKAFKVKVPWSRANSQLTLLVTIWFGYAILQIVNPESVSIAAWFYAMRGLALYQWLFVPLGFILFNRTKDLHLFFVIWGILSFLATVKGMQQLIFGVDKWEQAWLDAGGNVTHVLFGKLRIFSFYSDAGQFGASQGHTGVVFGILALFAKNRKFQLFCGVVALAGLLGMMISGTRGAIAVPAMAGVMFILVRKHMPSIIMGVMVGIGIFVFFKYTTIGNDNDQIRRMRTAFDPNDASLEMRRINQEKLRGYLATRPIGGGIGSTGNWGKRFSPNTFLANTATDSWFVAVWADTGIVGLYTHLFILFFILITGAYNVMYKIRDVWLKGQITALVCGMAGIMLASYGNGIFGQFPTCILMYAGMVFMFIAPKLDAQLMEEKDLIQKAQAMSK
jgi:hypothetical protein